MIYVCMGKPVTPGGGECGGDGGSKAGTTTFVQADPTCFRDLVQRLTGPSGNQALTSLQSPAPKPTQKLHERRKCNSPKIEIGNPVQIQFLPFLQLNIPTSPPIVCGGSPGGGYWGSPWSCPASPSTVMLLSPPPSSLQASPVSTPVPVPVPVRNSNKRASPSPMELLNPEQEEEEEEKAIKEKRFYLHPSPRSKPRLAAVPELLTLFPLKSPTPCTDSNET